MNHTAMLRASLSLCVVLLALAGCGTYDPPVQGDHASAKYKTDLTECRKSSRETVRLRNAATLERWVISPITGPPVVRADIRNCIAGKGYVLAQPAS
jgi:hypothetical protein